MKRSDVIYEINDIIKSRLSDDDKAECILNTLEWFGMLPPSTYPRIYTNIEDMPSEEELYRSYVWEKE